MTISILDGDPDAAARLRPIQGLLVAAAFSNLLVASNALTPLLPIYRHLLGLSPLMMTLTFVSYVGVLFPVLLGLSRPRLVRLSPWLLTIALVCAIGADLFMTSATVFGIMAGRFMMGLAGGFGTGSASALVVAAFGARGRAISATGNLVGAVVGTTFSELVIVALAEGAIHVTFLVHALVCLILLVLLGPVLWGRRRANAIALADVTALGTASIWPTVRANAVQFAVGCVGWVLLSLSVVLLPSFFAELDGMGTVNAVGIIAFLICSAAGQLLSPQLTRLAPWLSGVPAMAVGATLVPLGGAIALPALSLLGFPILGFGIGLSYRLALVVLTRGALPARQGALASLYAAVSYGAATLAALGSGLLGNAIGLHATVIWVFVGLAVVAALLTVHAARLRDTVEGRPC